MGLTTSLLLVFTTLQAATDSDFFFAIFGSAHPWARVKGGLHPGVILCHSALYSPTDIFFAPSSGFSVGVVGDVAALEVADDPGVTTGGRAHASQVAGPSPATAVVGAGVEAGLLTLKAWPSA